MSASYDGEIIVRDTDDAETTVLSDLFESLESLDDLPAFEDGPSASAFIAKPELELHSLMPEGPYTLRLLGKIYDEVYEDLMMELLRRGLLAGAEVWRAPAWIPFAEHPDFGAIQAQMSAELERVVERKRPRELTPQPHWKTPEELRRTDEVTQPHIVRDEMLGLQQSSDGLEQTTDAGLAEGSESLEESRKTAEFVVDLDELRAERSAPTRRVSGDITDGLDLEPRDENPFAEMSPTDVSMPLALAEVSEESIETREIDSPLLATEVPTKERPQKERLRQASPLEGNHSPTTAFPTSASRSDGPQQGVVPEPAPAAAILKKKRIRRETADVGPAIRQIQAESKSPKTRIPTWAVYLAALAIILSLVALGTLALRYWMQPADASPQSPAPPESPALGAASMRVQESLPRAFADAREVEAVAASLPSGKGEHSLWLTENLSAVNPTAENLLLTAEANLANADYQRARELATEAFVLGAPVERASSIFSKAALRDPEMRSAKATQLAADEIVSAKSSSDHFLVQLSNGRRGLLYASTRNDPDTHEPMLAMATLCRVLACDFEVAPTRRVFVEREQLSSALVESPREGELRIDELRWATSDGGDLVEAALVEFPSGKAFPIKRDDVWRTWLEPGALSAETAAGAIEAMREAGHSNVSPSVLRRELSQLLTIDYLVNNWTRLPDEEIATTLVSDGTLVSIRHDAAFATRSSKRVSGRFGWVRVFDRGLVARIELLEPQSIDPLLFSNDDPVTQARRDEFWNQREELLEAVEDAEREGSEAVWLTR